MRVRKWSSKEHLLDQLPDSWIRESIPCRDLLSVSQISSRLDNFTTLMRESLRVTPNYRWLSFGCSSYKPHPEFENLPSFNLIRIAGHEPKIQISSDQINDYPLDSIQQSYRQLGSLCLWFVGHRMPPCTFSDEIFLNSPRASSVTLQTLLRRVFWYKWCFVHYTPS